MKVLHIFDHSIPMHSGYTFRSRAILDQQRAMGWLTSHITSSKHTAESMGEETIDGLLFYRSANHGRMFGKLPILNQLAVVSSLRKRLDQVIEMERPDIIHAHSPALNGIAAVQAGKKYGLPVVYECRAFWEDAAVDHGTSREWGLRYRLTRSLESYVFQKADAITTICEGLKRDIINRGLPEEKITVIPNGVDIQRFSISESKNTELLHELNLENNVVLGFIGSFYAYEGLIFLVQSMPEILKLMPDVRLLLVGGGPQQKQIETLVKSLNIQDKVLFTGRIPNADVEKYYSLVDIFIYPRFPMRLTDLVTPLKPLEAMAQGKLVLASDVGGHKELIRDGENGRLFKAGNAASLIETAVDMIEANQLWSLYRHAGRTYVENERNWAVTASHYKPVFERLVGGPR